MLLDCHSHSLTCTLAYSRALSCTLMQSHRLSCTPMHSHALTCTLMYSHALSCTLSFPPAGNFIIVFCLSPWPFGSSLVEVALSFESCASPLTMSSEKEGIEKEGFQKEGEEGIEKEGEKECIEKQGHEKEGPNVEDEVFLAKVKSAENLIMILHSENPRHFTKCP